ncbi:hypothetical protein [uncultured Clostridium sp.]|uniref:hypothetical protein n=1 Tax=uncultured Clostridium sp. TaxID=59620 RepID=UPI00262382CA|nr:hypothetical protein [uncultured Clostridium sp.]
MRRVDLQCEKEEFDLKKLIEETLEKENLKIDEENKIIAILDNETICLGNRKEKIKREIEWIYENNFNKEIILIVPYNEKANLEIEIREKVKVKIKEK